jgi:hypothetical protein
MRVSLKDKVNICQEALFYARNRIEIGLNLHQMSSCSVLSQSEAPSLYLCLYRNLQVQGHFIQISVDFSLFGEIHHIFSIFLLLLVLQILSDYMLIGSKDILPEIILHLTDQKIWFFVLD